MKQLLALFLFLISLNGFSQKVELKLASDIWPPFTNVEDEKSISFDIVKEALNGVEVEVAFEILEFEDVLGGIEKKKFDGSAALWYSKDREKQLVYSEAYLQNQLILVGRKGSVVNATSFKELDGSKIGVVENYAYGNKMYDSADIELIYGKSDQKNLEHLLTKKVDYILVDALLIQYLLKYQLNDVSEFLEIGASPMITKSLHFALSKDFPNAKDIINKFNQEIDRMIVDGTYHQLLDLNWIRADIDGDGKVELVLIGDNAGVNPPSNSYGVHQAVLGQSEGYVINGKHYSTWDDVPDSAKNPLPKAEVSNYHEGGFILKF